MKTYRNGVGWIIALCGLWEAGDIAAVFVPGFGSIPAFLWNHILTGLVLMAAGAWLALTGDGRTIRTLAWTAAAAGAWLALAAFVLGGAIPAGGRWNDVIVGGVAAGLGVWAALSAGRGG